MSAAGFKDVKNIHKKGIAKMIAQPTRNVLVIMVNILFIRNAPILFEISSEPWSIGK
jgi:hypothetical protein